MVAAELDWIGEQALATGLTTTFIVLQQDHAPGRWRQDLDRAAVWRNRGAQVVPLVAGRPFGVLFAWELRHPFRLRPTYEALDHLPLAERLEQLRKPEVRANILAEAPEGDEMSVAMQQMVNMAPLASYVLGDDPDYEQPGERSLGALAEAAGTSVEALAYDALCDQAMLLLPLFNYTDRNHDALFEQMADPAAVVGLDDAGAHCGAICDASIPTYMLTHWVRDRSRGPRLELADAVRRMTSQPADLYGFSDRGRLREGLRADLNVIDLAALRLHAPRVAHDLPAGGLRILQDASGYRATAVAGQITRRHGQDTGARPGRLLRGPAT